jgi:hypothetical protein
MQGRREELDLWLLLYLLLCVLTDKTVRFEACSGSDVVQQT